MKKADIDWSGETLYAIQAPNESYGSPKQGKIISYGWTKDFYGRLSEGGNRVKVAVSYPGQDRFYEKVVPLSHILRPWAEQEIKNAEDAVFLKEQAATRAQDQAVQMDRNTRFTKAVAAVGLKAYVSMDDQPAEIRDMEEWIKALEYLARLKEWRATLENDGVELRVDQ